MYKLEVVKGSGWQGANWFIQITIPAHGIWPVSWVSIGGTFETEQQALDEAAKFVADIVQSSSERR